MTTPAQKRQAEIDHLYGLPLDEFTPARDELARRLRREGDRDSSDEVKRMRKPSLPAWALNQARRRDRKRVDKLFSAGERLRDAQQRLVAGGEPGMLKDAVADQRKLVEEVVALGEQALAEAGHAVNASLQTKLRATVHAAAVSPEPGDLLRAGRLLRDYEVSDLGLFAPGAEAPPSPAPRARRVAAPATDSKAGERRDQQRAAGRITRELERARARHQKLADQLADAQRRASEARRNESDTRKRASEAQRQADKAAAQLDRAQAGLEQAGAKAGEARAQIDELEAQMRELERSTAAK